MVKQKFLDVLNYFKEKYWFWVLRDEYPDADIAAWIFGFTVFAIGAALLGTYDSIHPFEFQAILSVDL